MADFVCWFIAIFTVISAITVVVNNQLLYSAIALLFTLFGVAGMYIFLWADFIAGVQLLVYIGGINVLIIFGIMLTNRISSVRLSQTNVQQGIGGVVGLWTFMMLTVVITKTQWYQSPGIEPSSTVYELGTLLMTNICSPLRLLLFFF